MCRSDDETGSKSVRMHTSIYNVIYIFIQDGHIEFSQNGILLRLTESRLHPPKSRHWENSTIDLLTSCSQLLSAGCGIFGQCRLRLPGSAQGRSSFATRERQVSGIVTIRESRQVRNVRFMLFALIFHWRRYRRPLCPAGGSGRDRGIVGRSSVSFRVRWASVSTARVAREKPQATSRFDCRYRSNSKCRVKAGECRNIGIGPGRGKPMVPPYHGVA
ncbi:hypothetical protein LY76DRAFT_236108 [Colletotrichum caudatum]|nr:hypothetical protein LY76DRAFT_236108 [Colletotrichum caudatum]